MKKLFTFVAVAAVALSATSCGSNQSKDLDTLSYAIGADFGMGINFSMAQYDIDKKVLIKNIESFYKSGDAEGEEIKAIQERLQEYERTVLMPYMNQMRINSYVETDCPDTLVQPELYNEKFTRKDVSAMLGKNYGAMLQTIDEDIVLRDVLNGINDAQALKDFSEVDSLMRITSVEMRMAFQKLQQRAMAKAEEERKALMEKNTEASAAWLAEVEKQEGVQKTESGLLYRIDREGSAVKATEDTDVVLVNYEGKTAEGKVFDSSYERGEPISFPLDRVISGWTEGMKLVGVGGQITLWIPAELAYGERGAGQDIGPNQALEFKVELLEVNPEK
jgi:FKBP-type peptidyl-prolyl cis-trans isomerase FkpA